MPFPLYESKLKSLKLLGRGKVRDMYAVDGDRLLIITSDRLSAFDVVLPDPIPDKGRVLNEMSNFWFRRLGHIVPNHLDGAEPESVVKGGDEAAQVKGRAVVVRKLKPLPIDAGGQAAGGDFHAGNQGGSRRARREHIVRAGREADRQDACLEGA